MNFSGLRIELQHAIRRRGPDLALAVDVERHGAAERRHVLRRLVDGDLLGLRIELAEAAAARIDVEPEIALPVAREPVGIGGAAVGAVDLEEFHLAGLGVDASDRDVLVGRVRGEPDVAVEIHAAVMGHEAELGGRAERPVRAVIDGGRGADAGVGIERNVIERPHRARRFAGRPRPVLDLHRAFARAAHLGEIGGELLLVDIDDLVGLADPDRRRCWRRPSSG